MGVTSNGDNKKDLYEEGLRFVYRLDDDYAILAPKSLETGKTLRRYMLFRKTGEENADAFVRKVPYQFNRSITKTHTPEWYFMASRADDERARKKVE